MSRDAKFAVLDEVRPLTAHQYAMLSPPRKWPAARPVRLPGKSRVADALRKFRGQPRLRRPHVEVLRVVEDFSIERNASNRRIEYKKRWVLR